MHFLVSEVPLYSNVWYYSHENDYTMIGEEKTHPEVVPPGRDVGWDSPLENTCLSWARLGSGFRGLIEIKDTHHPSEGPALLGIDLP